MKDALDKWFQHIQIPHKQLNGKAICPFAKMVVEQKQYTIEAATIENIAEKIELCNVETYKVCIFYLENYQQFSAEALESTTKLLNMQFMQKDKVVLENDPRSPFTIQGVTTSFLECYIWIVQSLSDLNAKSDQLKATSYYDSWTQQQIEEVVAWRKHISYETVYRPNS